MAQDKKDVTKNNILHDNIDVGNDVEVIASDIHVANKAVVDVAVVKNTTTDDNEKKSDKLNDEQEEETKVFPERVAEVLGDETAEKLVDAKKAVLEQADDIKDKAKQMQSKADIQLDSVKKTAEQIKDNLQNQVDTAKDKIDEVKDEAEELKDTATDKVATLKQTATNKVADVKDEVAKVADDLKQTAQDKIEDGKDEMARLKDTVTDKVAQLKETASDKAEDIKDGIDEQVDTAKKKAEQLKDVATDKVAEVKETISNKVSDIKETAGETFESTKSKAEELVATIKDKVQGVKETAEDKLSNAKQTAETKLDEAKDKADDLKADDLKETVSEEVTSIQETIQEKLQAGKDEFNTKKEELLAKKDELVEKVATLKDDLQADFADESNSGLAGKLGVIGSYFASIYSTKERYEAVDLSQDGFGENVLRQQGSQIGQQLLGSKGVTAHNLASKVVSDDKMNAISEAVYGKIANWANAWAKSDLAKDERFDGIRTLSDDERDAFVDDIANQNRALAAAGGVSGLFGLKGVVADTAWLLMVSLKSIYQLSIIYDKPLTGKEGAKFAYGILSACDLDKLQEKQVIMTALALGDRVLKEAQATSLSEELKKIGRKYQDRSYSKSLDELSKLVNLDRFNPKWLHYVLPVGSVVVSAHYNNELIEEVLGIAKATFANNEIKGLIEDKTTSFDVLDDATKATQNDKEEEKLP